MTPTLADRLNDVLNEREAKILEQRKEIERLREIILANFPARRAYEFLYGSRGLTP